MRGSSGSAAAKLATLKGRSTRHPTLTLLRSLISIPLSLSQIYSRVGYTRKYLQEVLLWKLNIKAVCRHDGTKMGRKQGEKETLQKVIKTLVKLWTISSPGNEV